MKNDFVFTQTKEVTMTPENTVVILTEKLETVDVLGEKQLCGYTQTKKVDYHDVLPGERRAA